MTKRQVAEASQNPDRPASSAEPATTRAALSAALVAARPARRQPIGELLTGAGFVDDTGIHRALAAQGNQPSARLGGVLLTAGEINEDQLYRALSEQLGVAYVRLGEFDIDPAALGSLPPDIARAHRVLPLMFHHGRLVIATDDPTDSEKLSALRFRAQTPIEVVLASPTDLDTALVTHYPLVEDAALEFAAERLLEQIVEQPEAPVERLAQQRPIVRLVNNLLLNAVQRRASDIHLHPRERCADVRYRIDGSLVAAGEFNRALFPALVARIKVLATMNVAERRLPQDGAIHMNTPQGPVDMRVSICASL